jgi:hypothetical protein
MIQRAWTLPTRMKWECDHLWSRTYDDYLWESALTVNHVGFALEQPMFLR